MNSIETIDPSEARWDPSPHIPVDKVETAFQKRWDIDEKPRPMENLRFDVFQILVLLAILSVLVYAVLIASRTIPEMKDFATIVVAPMITIVASAAGYYFGSRSSRQADK